MGLALLALTHVALVAALALAAAAIGGRLARRVRFHDGLERAVVSCTLGLGAIAYLVLALGLAHLLTAPIALGSVAALALACAPWPAIARLDRRRPLRTAGVALALLVVTAPLWGRALAPPLEWDAISYHLASAKQFAAHHAVAPTETLRYPVFSRLQEMLFTLLLLAGSESAAQGTQTLAVVLAALALVSAGRRLERPRAGWLAAALWLGSPLAWRLGNAGYIDSGLALCSTVAATALVAWIDSRERAWLGVAAAAGGFAAASKYTGVVVVALLAVVALSSGRGRLRAALGFAALAAIIGAPFYVLNAIWCGNPVFPFAGGIFGPGPWWSAEDLARQMTDLAHFGAGRSLSAIALLPWRLAFAQGAFATEGAWISPGFVLLAPITLWCLRKEPVARRLVMIAAGFTIVWFLGAQSLRYLLPILPLLALAHGLALDRVLGRLLERRAAFVALAAGLAAWGVIDGAWQCVSDLPPAPAERAAWLTARRPVWAAIDLLNRTAPGYRLYQLGHEELAYYADGTWLGDHFGPWRYTRVLGKLGDARALEAELRAMGATHLLLSRVRMGLPPLVGPEFEARFERRFENAAVLLYSLR